MTCRHCGQPIVEIAPGRWGHTVNMTWRHHRAEPAKPEVTPAGPCVDCGQPTVRVPVKILGAGYTTTLIEERDLPLLGRWSWKTDGRYVKRHTTVGGAKPKGRDVTFYLHRVIADPADALEVDHRNRDPFDNRRCNLRPVTRAQNAQNVSKRPGATSSYIGVSWCEDRQKWLAQACDAGTVVNLGRYSNEAEAARVVEAWRREHWAFHEPQPT